MFGFFKKKPAEEAAKPAWPFTDPNLSEDKVRQAAQMSIRRLKLEARLDAPEYPPVITNNAKTMEQRKAIERIWREEVSNEVQKRAATRRPGQGGGENPWG